jgi:NAD(P)H-dependent FMN reductase
MSTRILALVGSLRAGSYNRQLAEAAIKHAPGGMEIDIFEGLADVAFYNEDIDRPGAVAAAERLRAEVQSADALLLVTPEYNGTIPAVLKNAIDWASRPFGAGAITGKPVAVIGTSGGRYGWVWAHEDARKAARSPGPACSMTSPCRCRTQRRTSPSSRPPATRRSPTRCRPFWPLSLPRFRPARGVSRSRDEHRDID